MKKYGTVYIITNLNTNMKYIGQTVGNIHDRFLRHYGKGGSSNSYIHRSIRKHGKNSFKIEELVTCFSLEALNEYESLLIKQYDTLHPNGYNLRTGGNQNGTCADIVKQKISKAKKGYPSPNKGKVMSLDQKLKISRTLGGNSILGEEIISGRKTIFNSAHEAGLYGFEPWNVISCCKGKRKSCHGFKFTYYKIHANQIGSSENKNSEHEQRIEGEPASAEYSPSTSPLIPT